MNKLFIYIPTYNRPDALTLQLASIMPNVIKYKDNVRVVVNDNNSEYEYYSLLKRKYEHCDNLVFNKNFGNIDGNANIALGFVCCKPDEFLWILSDNDIVNENSIEYILNHLSDDVDFVVMIGPITESFKRKWKWIDGFDIPISWGMGMISITLFNSNTIRSSIMDAFYYHNSSFPHLAVACSAASKKKEVVFLHIPVEVIHNETLSTSSTENPGDYSLSNVGMPHLLPLFPATAGKRFAVNWAQANGKAFYLNKHKYPALFAGSKYLLLFFGGFMMNLYLLNSFLFAKIDPVTNYIKKKLQQNLTPNQFSAFKGFINKL